MSDTLQNHDNADFLIAEFEALQNRAIGMEQNKASRINFMLVIIAAVGAVVSQLVELPLTTDSLGIILLVSVSTLGLGFFTLIQSIDESAAIVVIYRRAGRIRLWFVERDNSIASYVPFQYGDNHPRMQTRFSSFRGGEAAILVLNVFSFCVAVTTLIALIVSVPWYWLAGAALISAIIGWFGQRYFFQRKLDKAEMLTVNSIRFPYAKMYEKIEKSQTDVSEDV